MDIKTANTKSKNYQVNRAVQAMLIAIVERGMDTVTIMHVVLSVLSVIMDI